MIKDISLIVDVGHAHNIPMDVMELIRDQYADASHRGFGEQDFFSLVNWLKTAPAMNATRDSATSG
jgi:3-hydroxyisobutyrate dehydrogenase-like beta-hydroxyacid dehydrogenase